MIAPSTIVRLLNVPLDENQKNQVYFSSKSAQQSYMESKQLYEFNNFSYQRKDNVIRVAVNIDTIWNANYVMYNNSNFTNKWFYAFIIKKEYVDEKITLLYVKTDVWQTWLTDITFKQSFVEREHVSDDVAGNHTIPENLELGEYICNGDSSDLDYDDFHICVAVSEDILRSSEATYHNSYNGVVSGLTYIILQDEIDVNYLIFRYNNAGKIDAISSIFMIPDGYQTSITWLTDSTGLIHYCYVSNQSTPFSLGNIDILKPTIIGESSEGYTPKNKKLLTYPYIYIMATNNAGANVIYRYEDFSPIEGSTANTIRFTCIGSISPGCNIKVLPINYKNHSDENYAEGFNGAKLPIGGWINDVYTNWLTQNGVNIAVNLVGDTLQIAGGVMLSGTGAGSLAGAGNVMSGITGISSTLGQIYQHSLIPNQAEGNINSSDIMYSAGKISPSIYRMCIKEEYAKIVDNYFNMFGYKVNTVKTPNFTSRPYWNYVKTIDCNITGDIPEEDIVVIKSIFDNGVTIWKNANNIGNYSLDNSISS